MNKCNEEVNSIQEASNALERYCVDMGMEVVTKSNIFGDNKLLF
jgi:hypothetical protein